MEFIETEPFFYHITREWGVLEQVTHADQKLFIFWNQWVQWGAAAGRRENALLTATAEIIPVLPDPDNAGVGSSFYWFSPLALSALIQGG